MRRIVSCVLMMALLCGCAAQREESPEQAAARLRTMYLAAEGCELSADITAEYGEQVFDFSVDARWMREGETVVTITQPELVAGITARIREGETVLEYDGVGFSLGTLDESGLTPMSAIPGLLESISDGYMARCSFVGEGDGRRLAVQFRDPDAGAGTGTETEMLFDPVSGGLCRGEISVDGVRRLTVVCTRFTMEMTEHGAKSGENVG